MKLNEILMYGPLGYTGYGNVTLNLAKTAHSAGIRVCAFPINQQRNSIGFAAENQNELDIVQELVNRPSSEGYDPASPCLKIWHQFDMHERIGRGKFVAFPFFEEDKLKPNEIINLNLPDQLVVASEWAKEVLINNNIKTPIGVAPLGVNTQIFDYKLNPQKTDQDPYVFIMIGKWEVRKGYDILLELFNKAFTSKDNVELWLLGSSDPTCFTEKEMNEWHNFYKSSPLSDKIKIYPRLKTQIEVAKVICQADCGLFMNRAEGWNLDLLEVMTMDKPIITTNYSAHTAFCNTDNSYLIDITEKEPAYDGKWFFGHGQWAHIGDQEKDQAIEYMRYVVNNNIRNNKNGIKTGQQLSWNNSLNKVIECMI